MKHLVKTCVLLLGLPGVLLAAEPARVVRADRTAPVVLDAGAIAPAARYAWSTNGIVIAEGTNATQWVELGLGRHSFVLTGDGQRRATLALTVTNLPLTDWPQWYGPDGRGCVPAPARWVENWPPVVLWRRPDIRTGGYAGNSSPVISEGRVYHCGNNRLITCLDLETGATIWEQKFAGGNATPAVDEDRVYTVGRDCHNVALACWDKRSGRNLWNTTVAVRAFNADGAGFSTSPVVYGDVLFLDTTALNKFTGAELWRRAGSNRAALAKHFTWGGRTHLMYGGFLVDWLTGKSVLSVGKSTAWWLHSTATCGADKVWLVQSVRHLGTGATLWSTNLNLRGAAEMYLQPVVMGDHGYFVRGSHGAGGPICAMDLKTGRELWRGSRWGTWIGVGDQLLAHGSGSLAVIRTGTTNYVEEAPAYRFTAAGANGYTLPAYANQRVVVLAGDGLTCLTTALSRPSLHNGSGATWNPVSRAAQLTGRLVNHGGKPAQVFVHWGPRDGGTDPSQWAGVVAVGARAPGDFAAAVTGLAPDAAYYYRCAASNAVGYGWADASERFTTPARTTLLNDNALALHWPLDQWTGTKLPDASPNGVVGDLDNSRQWSVTNGVIGQAGCFAARARLTSGTLRQPLRGNFTVGFWVQFPGEFDSAKVYFLRLQPVRLDVSIAAMTPQLNGVAGKTALQPGQWHHLAVTRAGDRLTLYLDAQPVAEDRDATLDPYTQLLFRCAGTGCLDDLRVYRRALIVEELRQLVDRR
jgi:outer membrane protein assembly factor BamB